jgi:hypothetical protein
VRAANEAARASSIQTSLIRVLPAGIILELFPEEADDT